MKRVARFRPQPDAAVSGHGDHFRCGLLAYRELDDLLAGGAPRLSSPERRYLRLGSRGLLLALRLRPAAGTALVTLMRMLMRMFAWLLPRRRCVAALREGGYRHRQDEVRKTRAKESTHRDSPRFPHASPPQRAP